MSAAPFKPPRYTVEVRDISTRLQRWMVVDGRIQMDVYHWHGALGEEQCIAVAAALNEVNDRHPETW